MSTPTIVRLSPDLKVLSIALALEEAMASDAATARPVPDWKELADDTALVAATSNKGVQPQGIFVHLLRTGIGTQ
jgi:hypothetical protein